MEQTLSQQFEEHEKKDKKRFDDLDTKIEGLATKDDIKGMQEAFKDFVGAMSMVSIGGKWGYKILVTAAVVVASLVTIFKGFGALWPFK